MLGTARVAPSKTLFARCCRPSARGPSRQTTQASRTASRPIPHRQTRWYSSRSGKKPEQSIFNAPTSPWEQLFAGSTIPASQKPGAKASTSNPPVRRVEMTAQEQKTFTDLFDEIFRIAEAVETKSSTSTSRENGDEAPIFSSEFYDRIRRTPRAPKWDQDMTEELDRKKEEMDMCNTDRELLEWMIVDVFGEAQRYEAEARKAGTETRTKRSVTLQPAWYPYILAHLMRTFRDKYHNPHTALAIFHYAKRLSIASYTFGCSTDAYNELIATHWSCFRNADAVLDALREMNVGGVTMNAKTGQLLDAIRRDVGLEQLWSDEKASSIIARLDTNRRGAGAHSTFKKTRGKQPWDQWKNQALQDDPNDSWGFNSWDTNLTPHKARARFA